MPVFENRAFERHEWVSFIDDRATGLRSIIAIHSTALGPAGGGIRMYPYADSAHALYDVLRLSRAMTCKSAIGAVLDDETVPKIRAKIVCGGANNQLADDRHGEALAERGILYVPDYVANAGGVLSGASEWMGMGEEELRGRVEGIYDSCSQVFARAEQDGVAPSVAAERLAREVIEAKASGAPAEQGASS